ncbi:ubiquitin-specific protease doa4, partial [Dinochytrium kinnereticum]
MQAPAAFAGTGADAQGDDRPSSLRELMDDAKVQIEPSKFPVKRWLTTSASLNDQRKQYEMDGDLDNAFIAAQKIVLELLPAHADIDMKDLTYIHLNKEALGLLPRLTAMAESIEERQRQWEKKNLSTHTVAFNPFRNNSVSLKPTPSAYDPFITSVPPLTNSSTSFVDPFAPVVQSNGRTLLAGILSSKDNGPSTSPAVDNDLFRSTTTGFSNASSLFPDMAVSGRSHSALPSAQSSSNYNPFRTENNNSTSAPTTVNRFNPFLTDTLSQRSLTTSSFQPISQLSASTLPTPPRTPPIYSSDTSSTTKAPLSKSTRVPPPGLRNLGNTCYMNSTLQCLSMTMPLSSYFFNDHYLKHLNLTNPRGSRGVVVGEFAKLMKSMWKSGESVKSIGEVSEQFCGNEQHDSSEFLTFLLDMIHEDLNVASNANSAPPMIEDVSDVFLSDEALQQKMWNKHLQTDYSIVVDLFQGQLKSRLQCLTCNKASVSFHPFMYLSVPIPSTNSNRVHINDCVRSFIASEQISGDDAWFCPRCKAHRNAIKFTSVSRFPSILIIHLKRFEYRDNHMKMKIYTEVEYPIQGLDIGFCDASGNGGEAQYNLYGVL